MFTGIISEVGEVSSFARKQGGAVLMVRAGEAASSSAIGDSIAVSGACLTVTSISGPVMSFDLSDETLNSTTLGTLKPKDKVNIEQSLSTSGKLGGHFVTGHVDEVGRIKKKAVSADSFLYEIGSTKDLIKYLVKKGSVTVDGISLTVVDVLNDSFTLVIIPHTLDKTTLGLKKAGDAVNLEADILGKYIYRYLDNIKPGESPLYGALKREGFL